MKERPILFNGDMVRAILDGRKTQTRRIVKLYDGKFPCSVSKNYITACEMKNGVGPWWHPYGGHPGEPLPIERLHDACPFGKPGDRLWVRENFYLADRYFADAESAQVTDPEGYPRHIGYSESMGSEAERCARDYGVKQAPSIHMPRWASRINLEIKNVRVERLQDISEEDAKAEGFLESEDFTPKGAFKKTWNDIYGNWNENPWVWVIEFEPQPLKNHESKIDNNTSTPKGKI